MIILKIVAKIIAIPMIILLGSICLLAEGAANLYCHVAGFIMPLIVICVILAIITSQWTALLIFGMLVAASVVLTLLIGWTLGMLEYGRDFFVELLHA